MKLIHTFWLSVWIGFYIQSFISSPKTKLISSAKFIFFQSHGRRHLWYTEVSEVNFGHFRERKIPTRGTIGDSSKVRSNFGPFRFLWWLRTKWTSVISVNIMAAVETKNWKLFNLGRFFVIEREYIVGHLCASNDWFFTDVRNLVSEVRDLG